MTSKRDYDKPEVRTVPARRVVESLGVAVAGTYGAIANDGFGD